MNEITKQSLFVKLMRYIRNIIKLPVKVCHIDDYICGFEERTGARFDWLGAQIANQSEMLSLTNATLEGIRQSHEHVCSLVSSGYSYNPSSGQRDRELLVESYAFLSEKIRQLSVQQVEILSRLSQYIKESKDTLEDGTEEWETTIGGVRLSESPVDP